MAGFPNAQSNPAGAIPVYLAGGAGGKGATSRNITTSTNTLVKTGAGSFYGLSVNTGGTTSTAVVYDGTDNTGALIGTYSTTAQGGPVLPAVGIAFSTGLFVVTTGSPAANITVSYA